MEILLFHLQLYFQEPFSLYSSAHVTQTNLATNLQARQTLDHMSNFNQAAKSHLIVIGIYFMRMPSHYYYYSICFIVCPQCKVMTKLMKPRQLSVTPSFNFSTSAWNKETEKMHIMIFSIHLYKDSWSPFNCYCCRLEQIFKVHS